MSSLAAEFLVTGVHTIPEYPPIALGMCMSYAKQEFAHVPSIQFSQHLIGTEEGLANLLNGRNLKARQHILLFSNYLWNTNVNLRFSRLAKQLDPTCITIHGGPDTPAYTEASKSFLEREPHVDFIAAGEGEETFKELMGSLVAGESDFAQVAGLRYFSKGTFVESAPRPRAADINRFPSPYLTGFFDGNEVTEWQSATIETFRGCPYACTFCDWGSIMGSKVKLFDLERVIAEVEWAATRQIRTIWIADSNFGLLERDVEIAKRICDIKKRTEFPQRMILTFAKNIKARVVEIVKMMVDAGLLADGIVSLQSSDAATLHAIRRTNIKTSEYEKLRRAFAEKDLPLTAELMLALPGSTVASFKADLAYHFDLPIEVFVHRTVMLPNSPMADPRYQREHEIEIDERKRVVATATMSRTDVEIAETICRLFQGVHRFGILRYVVRWFQWEKGLEPLDLIHDLVANTEIRVEYPLLETLVTDARTASIAVTDLVNTLFSFREQMRIGSSWQLLSAQFIAWVSRRHGFANEDAVNELGQLQARLMPSAERQFPEDIIMTNDVLRWYEDWLAGHGAALVTYNPGLLQVEDPFGLSNEPYSVTSTRVSSYCWELESALARSRRAHAKQRL